MINAIFAVDSTGSLGHKGSLPWPNNKEDLNYFKETTNGHVVVMGRRTWDDPKMPKPLPNRTNYVFSSQAIPGVRTLNGNVIENLKALEQIHTNQTIFVIGGKNLLESASPLFDNVFLTYIKGQYFSDTRIHVDRFLLGFQARSAKVSLDKSCTFMVYKNIFKV